MFNEQSIGHITGSVKITKNHLFHDEWTLRNSRSIDQMFFKPYESKKEFLYCARHTFDPMAKIGLFILSPILTIAVPTIIVSLAIVSTMLGYISEMCEDYTTALAYLNLSGHLIQGLCQEMIDVVMLPLSALVMLTRGISTGLQVTSLYDYDTSSLESALAS